MYCIQRHMLQLLKCKGQEKIMDFTDWHNKKKKDKKTCLIKKYQQKNRHRPLLHAVTEGSAFTAVF